MIVNGLEDICFEKSFDFGSLPMHGCIKVISTLTCNQHQVYIINRIVCMIIQVNIYPRFTCKCRIFIKVKFGYVKIVCGIT